jgi:hypothetical protein
MEHERKHAWQKTLPGDKPSPSEERTAKREVQDELKSLAQPPAGNYSRTQVVELSQLAAVNVDQNGIYTCVVSPPVPINDGDQIACRVIINAPQIDPDVIVIPQDTPVSATFSYYDIDYQITDKKVLDKSALWQAGGNPTFDYYAAYNTKITNASINYIILNIEGYYIPPGGFGNGGGSFIIPTGAAPGGDWFQGGKDSSIIGFLATFSYIDANGQLKTFKGTSYPNVFQYPTNNPRPGESLSYYGMLSGATITANSGITVTNGQIPIIPTSDDGLTIVSYPTDVTLGTVTLVGIAGGWGGAHQSANTPDVYTWPESPSADTGAIVAGSHPEISSTYDVDSKTGKILEPYLMTQFSVAEVNYTGGANTRQLDVQTLNTVVRGEALPKGAFANTFTQQLSDPQGIKSALAANINQIYIPNNPALTSVSDPINQDMVFRRIDFDQSQTGTPIVFDNTNTYVYADAGTNDPPPYILGAQQLGISYNENFSVVAHTPMQLITEPNEQQVAIYQTGTGVALDPYRFFKVAAATGIVFHDLQPASLWRDQLGLADKMTVPLLTDSNGVAYYEQSQFLQKITEGQLGLDGFPIAGTGGSANWRKQEVPLTTNPTYLNVTGNFREIVGDAVSSDVAGGLYYVEVIGDFGGSDGFIDSAGQRPFMASVVSTQYVNNDIVTGDVDQSLVYTHRGVTGYLSKVNVRITEGPLKTPITGLGPQNVVEMFIIKPPAALSDDSRREPPSS